MNQREKSFFLFFILVFFLFFSHRCEVRRLLGRHQRSRCPQGTRSVNPLTPLAPPQSATSHWAQRTHWRRFHARLTRLAQPRSAVCVVAHVVARVVHRHAAPRARQQANRLELDVAVANVAIARRGARQRYGCSVRRQGLRSCASLLVCAQVGIDQRRLLRQLQRRRQNA